MVFGGSSGAGGWDHLRLLLLAQAAGVPSEDLGKIRWVQYEGGTDAVTQMLGGFIDVVSTDLGEIAGFVEAGQIEALTVMSDEPVPGKFESIPTAKSQGYDVTGYNWRGFYIGGEVPDEAYDFWVDTPGEGLPERGVAEGRDRERPDADLARRRRVPELRRGRDRSHAADLEGHRGDPVSEPRAGEPAASSRP